MGARHLPCPLYAQQRVLLLVVRGLDMRGCTFEHRLQKWVLTAGKAAKPRVPPAPHRRAFKPKLEKAVETNFVVKQKGKGRGVLLLAGVQWHQVCKSELWDCDEQTRVWRSCERAGCGASAAAFLQPSLARSQRPRWHPQGRAAQGTVKPCANSHSVLHFQPFPFPSCCLFRLGTRRQVPAARESGNALVHIVLSSGCAWSLQALSEGCGGGTHDRCLPQLKQVAEGCVCRKGPHTRGRREERERDQPRCVSLLNSSFLPLKPSQDNSWHVGSAFSISSRSLILGAAFAARCGGASAGTQLRTGRDFSLLRLAEVGVWQVIINRVNCCHPSSV